MTATRFGAGGSHVVLTRLRWQLTGVFVLISALGLVTFVVLMTYLDARYASGRRYADLRGQSSRAAALMYVSDSGVPQLDAVTDDDIAHGPGGLAVFSGSGANMKPLLVTSGGDAESTRALAREALDDAAETGTFGWADTPIGRVRAVALPWFNGDRIAGAVVAVDRDAATPHSALLLPTSAAAAGLLVLLGITADLLVRRSLHPAEAALLDRERFLATAAHELRAPLARLRAGAELARRGAHPADPTARALHRLVTVADSAGQIVANLLLATRIDHAEVPVRSEPVRLDVLACDVETAFDAVADIAEPVTVTGDAALLRHALVNLVENALRHGRVGEDIPTVTIRVAHENGCPVIEVADDGPGFPPDVDVMARYVSGARGGTGLGLPLVEWIARQHGATLRLSEPGDRRPGAVVTITFAPN